MPLFDEIYSTENEGKAAVIEGFKRTLKQNLFKRFTKNNNQKWIKLLPEILKNYNNKIHSSINETPNNASKNPEIIAKITNENNLKNENIKKMKILNLK